MSQPITGDALRTLRCDKCGASPAPPTADGHVRCGACGRELGELVLLEVLVKARPDAGPV